MFGDPEGKGRVLKLLHYLYGHPLANAAWAKKWLQIETKFGFEVGDNRQGAVLSYMKDRNIMLMATVVDVSVVAYDSDDVFEKFMTHVEHEVPIAVSEAGYICGLPVRACMQ